MIGTSTAAFFLCLAFTRKLTRRTHQPDTRDGSNAPATSTTHRRRPVRPLRNSLEPLHFVQIFRRPLTAYPHPIRQCTITSNRRGNHGLCDKYLTAGVATVAVRVNPMAEQVTVVTVRLLRRYHQRVDQTQQVPSPTHSIHSRSRCCCSSGFGRCSPSRRRGTRHRLFLRCGIRSSRRGGCLRGRCTSCRRGNRRGSRCPRRWIRLPTSRKQQQRRYQQHNPTSHHHTASRTETTSDRRDGNWNPVMCKWSGCPIIDLM